MIEIKVRLKYRELGYSNMVKQICVVFILDSLINSDSCHHVFINNVRSVLGHVYVSIDFIFISVSRLFVILIV